MEKREIFLEKNKSKVSVNKESELAVSLSAKTRLLPYGDISERLSLIKLYNDEKDACKRYRMIFTINPICTNVLFNSRSEIIRREGSSACTVLDRYENDYTGLSSSGFINTSALNILQAIRDTEYTHKDLFTDENPYVYHCGWDIFNNHMLRNEDFIHISKVNGDSRTVFNTIRDYLRDKEGRIVTEKISYSTPETKDYATRLHVYQYDNILSMYNAFKNKLDERDGWYGFINPGNIVIDNAEVNGKQISINKMMNNNKSCELYELYPDQSLYSFIPKFNKFRNRLEYNWDYDLVYPYENEYNKLKEIVGADNWMGDDIPIRIISAKKTSSTSGSDFVVFKTMFKHTLEQGDYVRLFYVDGNSFDRINRRFKVVRCGDIDGNETDRYFCVRAVDMGDRFKFNEEGSVVFVDNDAIADFYYKKEVNGYECKYYIRKLKRIKTERFESEINKLAFGENIYGDRVAQIIFTDDIDVEGLVDNLGRPLSEVYLYIFKTNRGHSEWYDEGDYNNEKVEFSHCFGKITTGLDLPSECVNYNVRKLHNIDKGGITPNYIDGFNYAFENSCLQSIPEVIQDDITIENLDNDGFVYGDVVEFNPYTYTETVIENIYHRFNTAQRETTNRAYYDIFDDEIMYDDYDADINRMARSRDSFSACTYFVNKVSVENEQGVKEDKKLPGNLAPEGYFYNPKTTIKLADISDNISSVSMKQIKYKLTDDGLYYKNEGYDEEGQLVRYLHGNFEISTKYDFIKGDFIALYQSEDGKVFYGIVNDITGNTIDIAFEGVPSSTGLTNESTAMLTSREYIAPYATFLPASRAFVWRPLVRPSELPNDSALFDMPFANGCLYIHQNVNFFLKRQDPLNEFGLLYPEDANDNNEPQTKFYKKPGNNKIDTSAFETFSEFLNNICY